jgi:5-methylcytosine-specific restriction protein B
VDAIVDRWRSDCLVGDGSLLFAGEQIWTEGVVDELYRNFNEDPQQDKERTFEQKFEAQLADASQSCVRLAAEIAVVYFLFAVNIINGPRKRELLGSILSWKGDELPEGDVAAAMDYGIGNPGQFFNNGRPTLFAYLIAFARRIKALVPQEREQLLSDAWTFKNWLAENDGGEQMMRHILLHLLFPEEFERIASGDHKYRIRDTFFGLLDEDPSDAGDEGQDDDVDRQLYAIRTKLKELLPNGQPDIPGHIDFYSSPLVDGWDPGRADEDEAGAGISNLDALEFKRQVVLYGPPGTGKTYEAKQLARRVIYHQALQRWGAVPYIRDTELIEKVIDAQVKRLQLHQAYTYEDFIRGLRMTADGGTVPVDGYLLRLIDEVRKAKPDEEGRKPLPWVLILDELNRTDVSRLFGELFSLLEDRNENIDLAGLGDDEKPRTVQLPEDMYFVGTMNLIDQSVEQLDFALRRRFLWVRSGFREDIIVPVVRDRWKKLGERDDDVGRKVRHNGWDRFAGEVDVLAQRAGELNREIAKSNLLGEQYEVGHTYFFDIAGFIARWPKLRPKGHRPKTFLWAHGQPQPPLRDLWEHSLEPLLDEYLAGVDTDARKSELGKLRDVFTKPPE